MSEGRCTKFYPKDFCEQTIILETGFTQYVRPNNGRTTSKHVIEIDNRFVVPHNVDLLVKYQAHINTEKVNHDGMHKYLFKYVTKGFDCARSRIQPNSASSDSSNQTINEIDNYLECCYVPNEAAWRLLEYDIHHTDPSVERLPVHLPFENNVIYSEDDNLEQVIENPNNSTTKLTAWLQANMQHPLAKKYTYIEFPEYFTWGTPTQMENIGIIVMVIEELAGLLMSALPKENLIIYVCCSTLSKDQPLLLRSELYLVRNILHSVMHVRL